MQTESCFLRRAVAALLCAGALATSACGEGGGGGGRDAGVDAPDLGPLLPVVTTEYGDITGERQDEYPVRYFPNIPYAAAPLATNRFRPPQAPTPWASPRAYDPVIHQCPQVLPYGASGLPNGTEDCLFVNVVTPTPAPSNLPVVVWFHGGGFTISSGEQLDRATDGKRFAASQNVVVVTFNYRLGQLGFLAHPALSEEQGGHSGNYGMLDQIAALRWVRRNIAAFGGNPDDVTVYGQSAGGMSVCQLMTTPLLADDTVVPPSERPLFHRAILQSAPCDVPMTTLATAEATGTLFAQLVGCDDAGSPKSNAEILACLRNPAPAGLTTTEARDTLPMPNDFVRPRSADERTWGPIVDDYYQSEHPLDAIAAGRFRAVPVLGGYAADEGNTALHFRTIRSTLTSGSPPPRIVDQAIFDAEVNRLFAGGIQPSEVTALYGGASAPARYKPSSYTDIPTNPSAYTGSPAYITSYEQAFAAIFGDMNLVCPMRRTLRALVAEGVPVYAYHSTLADPPFQVTPVIPLGAFHSSDVQLVFGTPAGGSLLGAEFDATEQAASEAYQAYFGGYVRSGDPNVLGRPTWPAYTAAAPTHLSLGATVTTVSDPRGPECAIWDALTRSRLGVP